jgi:Na+-driven multidrug efflux pump
MKRIISVVIFNIILYLIISFILWDIQWYGNYETMEAGARYLSVVAFMVVNFYFIMLRELL